jgi:hypothetical protein
MAMEASQRAPSPTLRDLVERYRAAAGGFGVAVPLTTFELGRTATEDVFSSYDEDYHISRFMHFSENEGMPYQINGELATHVSLDAEIETIL